jgi:hypothetical protein
MKEIAGRSAGVGLAALVAGCVPAYQVPDGAPRASLRFEVRHSEPKPFVTHYFREPSASVCKTTGALGSISDGNPLVRTKDTAEVAADAPLHLLVAVVPSPAERCNRTITFTPKAGSVYTITTLFDRGKQPACSTTVVADKGTPRSTEVPTTTYSCPTGFTAGREP